MDRALVSRKELPTGVQPTKTGCIPYASSVFWKRIFLETGI